MQQKIAEEHYFAPGETKIEDVWHRVADALATGADEHERYLSVLEDFKFVLAGRILFAAGTNKKATWNNCFVIASPHDSRAGILDSAKRMTEIMAKAGGVGINISSLRPSGAPIYGVGGNSSGPSNWAEIYSTITGDIVERGGPGRGALMLILNDWHPDLIKFITRKSEFVTKADGTTSPRWLEHANISVAISNGFMYAVENDNWWWPVFPDTRSDRYDTEWDGDLNKWIDKGYSTVEYEPRPAREIWDILCESAWKSADPGIFFIDTNRKMQNSWYFEDQNATNPCGEKPLGVDGVCNLGSMNLTKYVYINTDSDQNYFDLLRFTTDVKTAVRMLDRVIDLTPYPFDSIAVKQLLMRQIGLGTMGLADTLIMLGYRYGSEEALTFTEMVYEEMMVAAYEESIELAKEKGPFGKFNADDFLESGFARNLPPKIWDDILKYGIRNCFLLTQAPTGTTSMLAGVSSGIEPNYAFKMKRRIRSPESGEFEEFEYNAPILDWHKAQFREHTPGLESLDYISNYPELVTTMDVTPGEHVRMQAAAQKYIDSSVSKTVNLPNSAPVELVKNVFQMAYDLGCKGITVYREGSRDYVIASQEDSKVAIESVTEVEEEYDWDKYDMEFIEEELSKKESGLGPQLPPGRQPGEVLSGKTTSVMSPLGTVFITLNEKDGEPYECFVTVGKAGSQVNADAEAIGRLISLALRSGVYIGDILNQLDNIGGGESVGFGKKSVKSLPDGIAHGLQNMVESDGLEKVAQYVKKLSDNQPASEVLASDMITTPWFDGGLDKVKVVYEPIVIKQQKDLCPHCGGITHLVSGCPECTSCGWSKC